MDGEEADATRRAGGDGSDTLAGGAGGDGLNGGAGFDMASYAGSDARVTVNLAAGPASGGEATGDAFTDIEGLIGSPHSDVLSGNAGSNLLNGGLGSDVLTGGLGRDAFDFAAALGAANVDQITDFSVTDDAIRLDNAIFTALTSTGVLFRTAFATGTAAGDADDRIIYNSASGVLYYGADGAGGITVVSRPPAGRARIST